MTKSLQHDVPDQLLPGDKIIAIKAGGGDAAGQNDLPQQQSVSVDVEKDPAVLAPIQKGTGISRRHTCLVKFSRQTLVPGELEAWRKKSVMIRFQVSEDGSVTDFEIVQSAGVCMTMNVSCVEKNAEMEAGYSK